jgi:hypothetical protein
LCAGDGTADAKEEQKEWVDDGSLPLVDSALPFFLLDAHEEPAAPGTVYLFGKVGRLPSWVHRILRGTSCLFFVKHASVPVPERYSTCMPEGHDLCSCLAENAQGWQRALTWGEL